MNKLMLEPAIDTTHDATHGKCQCGWEGKLEGLCTETESEGWEYPDYLVSLCPTCNDALEDYY